MAKPRQRRSEVEGRPGARLDLDRAKRYREAIEEFEAAYRLKPHGAIHYNVAQCRERLGEWPGAIGAYHDYLREVPDANDRASVEASIARLEARLATSGVQVLIVYSEPPGADVRVDGHPRGRTPVHVVLPPGAYDLAPPIAPLGSAPGWRWESRSSLDSAPPRARRRYACPEPGRGARDERP